MSSLTIQIDYASSLALEVIKHILEENEKTAKIPEDDVAGPVTVANALADYFETAASIEEKDIELEGNGISEFGHHGLDLLDRVPGRSDNSISMMNATASLVFMPHLLSGWRVAAQ